MELTVLLVFAAALAAPALYRLGGARATALLAAVPGVAFLFAAGRQVHLVAPGYFIASGARHGEGVVLVRDRKRPAAPQPRSRFRK